MPITQPTIDDFSDTTVMRVIRKVVNYLVTLIPKVNEEIANVTDSAGERLDTVEANVEALNKELPTDIRVNYTPSTGNFNIDYVKEDGDVLTSNTIVIVSGTTGEVTIVQNTSGISINGTALQSATTAQPGLMTPALVSSLNNVNDTTNDHTTMINAQAEAITELDSRVDVLEQSSSGGSGLVDPNDYNWTSINVPGSILGVNKLVSEADKDLYDVVAVTNGANSPGSASMDFKIIDLAKYKEANTKNIIVNENIIFNVTQRKMVFLTFIEDLDNYPANLINVCNIGQGAGTYGYPCINANSGTPQLEVSKDEVYFWGGKKKA